MTKDCLFAGGTQNRPQDSGKVVLNSVSNDFQLFSGKMDILYSLLAFEFVPFGTSIWEFCSCSIRTINMKSRLKHEVEKILH